MQHPSRTVYDDTFNCFRNFTVIICWGGGWFFDVVCALVIRIPVPNRERVTHCGRWKPTSDMLGVRDLFLIVESCVYPFPILVHGCSEIIIHVFSVNRGGFLDFNRAPGTAFIVRDNIELFVASCFLITFTGPFKVLYSFVRILCIRFYPSHLPSFYQYYIINTIRRRTYSPPRYMFNNV